MGDAIDSRRRSASDPVQNQRGEVEPQGKPAPNQKRASASSLLHTFIGQYEKDRDAQNKREDKRVRREWITIVFLMLAGGAGVVQSCEMIKVYKPIKSQAEATVTLGTAATEANNISNQSNRPWIGSSGITTTTPIMDGKPYTITLTITNAGKSPAKITQFKCGSSILEKSPIDPPYMIAPTMAALGSKSIVVPGQGLTCPGKSEGLLGIERSRMRLSSGELAYYAYGEVTYTDLTTSAAYVTQICYAYRPNVDIFAHCPTYNDAR